MGLTGKTSAAISTVSKPKLLTFSNISFKDKFPYKTVKTPTFITPTLLNDEATHVITWTIPC